MPEPAFAQPERRSFLLPILLALAALGIAIALAIHFFPATTINIDHIRTTVVPTQTLLKGNSIVGTGELDQVLFVASTIRVDNQLRVPIYLDDFHLTYIDASNAELTVEGTGKRDLPDLETNFPALKPLLTTPLLRETAIDPGKAVQGTVVFGLKISKDIWDQRKSAVIKVDLYHQHPVYVTIPR